MESFDERMKKLQTILDEAKNVVFFGGAGVSTESGIPDFRSKDGLYNQHDVQFDKYPPEYLLSHSCLYDQPKVFFEYYRQKMDCRTIEPNITHKRLAEMEKAGKLLCVITQNIDGLHQKAGSEKVYEVHGTTQRVYCDRCGKEYPSDILFTSTEAVPHCPCGGMLRPDVTLYEESLPHEAWTKSIDALAKADVFIIGGTSLTVYPANTLTHYFRGKHLIIMNRDETAQDRYAEIVFHESLGKIFEKIRIS